MAEIIAQAAALAVFLIGVMVAEAITYRAFGRPKVAVILLDIVLFVALVTGIFNYMAFYEFGLIFYAANFFVGMVVIVLIRSLEAAFGLTEKVRDPETIAKRMIPILAKAGMNADEIRNALRDIGVHPKTMDKLERTIESSIPPYLPKIVQLYDELADIKVMLAALAASSAKEQRHSGLRRRSSPKADQPGERPAETDPYAGIRHIIQAAIERAEREKSATESAQAGASVAQPALASAPAAPGSVKRKAKRRIRKRRAARSRLRLPRGRRPKPRNRRASKRMPKRHKK